MLKLVNKDFNKNLYFYKLPKKLFKPPYNKLSSNAKQGTDSEPTIVQNLYPNKNKYNNINKSKGNYSNY